jgi:phospholipase C
VLDALTSNPDVFSKTVLFITYDENDGFFDHMVPPCVPPSESQGQSTVSTANEIFPGNVYYPAGPYGLGPRVPMIVVSPWSKGGWVCSEVFDHTSIIRFIEQRFGVQSSHITPWRRAVCGDLTSAFDFAKANGAQPALPSTKAYAPPDALRHPDYAPMPPVSQSLPMQEPGIKPARALPYELQATARCDNGQLRIDFHNEGRLGACFHVRSGDASSGPWYYTVEAQKALSATWPVQGAYERHVYGPNGFVRSFKGNSTSRKTMLLVATRYQREGGLLLTLANEGHEFCNVTVENVYNGESLTYMLKPGEHVEKHWFLGGSYGWYDVIVRADAEAGFAQRFAGHVETGGPSVTDPAIGQVRWQSYQKL